MYNSFFAYSVRVCIIVFVLILISVFPSEHVSL